MTVWAIPFAMFSVVMLYLMVGCAWRIADTVNDILIQLRAMNERERKGRE